MELWVIAQDKHRLSKVEDIYCVADGDFWAIRTNRSALDYAGLYPTEERCLEIIDEIQKLLLSANPKEAFMIVDCRNKNEFRHIVRMVDFARENNFIAYDGKDGTNFQLIQPSVLVYEMPKE